MNSRTTRQYQPASDPKRLSLDELAAVLFPLQPLLIYHEATKCYSIPQILIA